MGLSGSPLFSRMSTRSTTSCGLRDPKTGKAITYGEIRLEEELQFSVYNFEAAEVEKLWEHLRLYEAECQDLLASYNDSFSPTAEKLAERHEKIHDRLVHDERDRVHRPRRCAGRASNAVSPFSELTTYACGARTSSTCSTPAAPSRSRSAWASSPASAHWRWE